MLCVECQSKSSLLNDILNTFNQTEFRCNLGRNGAGDKATLLISSAVCHRHLTYVYLEAQTPFFYEQNRFTHLLLVPNSFTNRNWLCLPGTTNARKHQKLILYEYSTRAQQTEFLIFTFLPFHHCSFFFNCIINAWTAKCEFVCVAK